MSTTLLQLYSQNHFAADGTQTVWDFTFANGYIRKAFVKAYYRDTIGNRTELTVLEEDFIGEFQITISPAVPADYVLVIYRDTPKDAPLVDFGDGARVSEVSLDTVARQAVHIAAEVLDGAALGLFVDDLGFKAMKQEAYTGSSVVGMSDNGKSHYKTDHTPVTVPNTLPSTFLSTIINDSTSSMNVTFDDAVGILQGSDDHTGTDAWTIAPRNSLSIMKVASGRWFISGAVTETS